MTGRITSPKLAAAAAGLAFFFVTAGADAQTVSPDEAVNASGAVSQPLALTDAQKRAIYIAVLAQRVRLSTIAVPVVVGAAVSPAAKLSDLPDQVAAAEPLAPDLKYAMVDDNVVVVDPIRMRVVEVIRGSATP